MCLHCYRLLKLVTIPDENLAGGIVRFAIGLSSDDAITTHNILNLRALLLSTTETMDLTGLEHAPNLTALELKGDWLDVDGKSVRIKAISDLSPLSDLTQLTELDLRNNAIVDISPLSGLTQLTALSLDDNNISDVSPLTSLTQLQALSLNNNNISDVSPLISLTQLKELYLSNNNISDVSPLTSLTQLKELYLDGNPLSYASIYTHIPVMQAKGIYVWYNPIAHPALLKVSGDTQEGAPGTVLAAPFIVEAAWMRGVNQCVAVVCHLCCHCGRRATQHYNCYNRCDRQGTNTLLRWDAPPASTPSPQRLRR